MKRKMKGKLEKGIKKLLQSYWKIINNRLISIGVIYNVKWAYIKY